MNDVSRETPLPPRESTPAGSPPLDHGHPLDEVSPARPKCRLPALPIYGRAWTAYGAIRGRPSVVPSRSQSLIWSLSPTVRTSWETTCGVGEEQPDLDQMLTPLCSLSQNAVTP